MDDYAASILRSVALARLISCNPAVANPRLEHLLTIAALVLLVTGCFFVLAPFVSALLWAVILSFTTWGAYERLLAWFGQRRTLAALVMTLLLATVLVAPVVIVAAQLSENANHLAVAVKHVFDTGLPPAPTWLARLPLIGNYAVETWQTWQSDLGSSSARGNETLSWLQQQAAPLSKWLLHRGLALGGVVLQLTLSVVAAFYLYRDGIAVVARFRSGVEQVAGPRAHSLIELAARTVQGVVYGILGTALAQGIVAAIGFSIAKVPGPFLLGLLTTAVSIIPGGPPVVWIPASLWLLHGNAPGWAAFMFLWGLVMVSGIETLIRPYLISHGTAQPFLLILLGVVGGLFAFGFIGIFLGPTLLAVGFALIREWTRGSGPGLSSDSSIPGDDSKSG